MQIPAVILLPPNRVWRTYPGGKMLDVLEGRRQPKDSHFPEDWIASTTPALNPAPEDHPEAGLSRIHLEGEWHLLRDVIQRYPDEMLGPEHVAKHGPNTGFLLKVLDSAVRLHIQAHPTIAFAREHLGHNSGKTEAYVILGIRSDVGEPYICLGFQRPLPRREFRAAVLAQDSAKLLSTFDRVPVRPGDVFVVPGGLPHAIGEGIFMIEIMEPTDFVVRFEFERGGYILPEASRFMGRGIDFALDMTDFSQVTTRQVIDRNFHSPSTLNRQDGGLEEILIDREQTPCFSLHRLRLKERFTRTTDRFAVGIVTRGTGRIRSEKFEQPLRYGDRFLVPHQTRRTDYSTDEGMEIVLALPPA